MIVNAFKSGLIASLVILLWTVISNYLNLDVELKQNLGSLLRVVLTVIFVFIQSKKSKNHPLSIASFQFILMMLLTLFVFVNIWDWIYKNIFF